jgi:hypothetical protein
MSYVIAWDKDRFKIFGSIEGSGSVTSVSGFVSSIRIKPLKVVDSANLHNNIIEKDFYSPSRSGAIGSMIAWLDDSDNITQKVRSR